MAIFASPAQEWLFDAAQVTTRYRPGEMLYAVRDPLLGAEGILNVTLLALSDSEGLIVRTALAAGPLPDHVALAVTILALAASHFLTTPLRVLAEGARKLGAGLVEPRPVGPVSASAGS